MLTTLPPSLLGYSCDHCVELTSDSLRQENPPGDVKQMNITLDIHSMVNKRYKQLRKEGVSTQEAMAQARREFGLDREPEKDPAQQVGAMFGLS